MLINSSVLTARCSGVPAGVLSALTQNSKRDCTSRAGISHPICVGIMGKSGFASPHRAQHLAVAVKAAVPVGSAGQRQIQLFA